MTARPLSDRPCVLPPTSAWILDAAHLQDTLELAAQAAELYPDDYLPLHTTAYETAAAAIARSRAAALRTPTEGQIRILVMPVYQLNAVRAHRAGPRSRRRT